jgi:hypothetical protein
MGSSLCQTSTAGVVQKVLPKRHNRIGRQLRNSDQSTKVSRLLDNKKRPGSARPSDR